MSEPRVYRPTPIPTPTTPANPAAAPVVVPLATAAPAPAAAPQHYLVTDASGRQVILTGPAVAPAWQSVGQPPTPDPAATPVAGPVIPVWMWRAAAALALMGGAAFGVELLADTLAALVHALAALVHLLLVLVFVLMGAGAVLVVARLGITGRVTTRHHGGGPTQVHVEVHQTVGKRIRIKR